MPSCTLCRLKEREVINVCDGRRLGCVEDIEFEIESGKICSLILSERGGILGFGRGEGIYVPWQAIKRIGPDIILVDIGEEPPSCCEGAPDRPKPQKPPKRGLFG